MKSMLNNKFKFITVAILAFLMLACSFALILPHANSIADEPNKTSEFYLPQTSLEYKTLSSPVDAYYSEDLTVVAQSDALFVYRNGKYEDTSYLTFTSLKQVKRLSDNVLLIIDNGIIYSVDLNAKTKTELRDTQNNQISGNYFDLNKNYLVTAFGTSALIYRINGNSFSKITPTYTVKNDLPIAINDSNQVFFVDSTGISMVTAGKNSTKSTIYNANPSKMIANDEHIYYIESSKIIRLDISNSEKTDLEFSEIDDEYTLGCKIYSPMGLSFKGKNLLITDASAVQEFKVENGNLTFTGFAIARNRSAFNRIGTTASDVEKYGDTVAVLDEFKLTVFYNANDDYYNRENFDNFLSADLGGEMPSSFALGEKAVMLVYRQNTSSSSVRFLDVESGKISDAITVFNGNIMLDVCYQSGYFYLLVSNGSSPSVYKFSESDYSKNKINNLSLFSGFTKISVDVFGNVYLASDSAIYKYTKNSAYSSGKLISMSGVKKIANDLAGRLFVLNSDGFGYLESGNFINVYTPTLTTSAISAFAMDFISDEVYFIYQSEELLSLSTGLTNLAISSVVATPEYKTTGSNSIEMQNLKIYAPKTGANVYSVNPANGKFEFDSLITEQSEYVYICDITVSPALTITALAGKQGIVLINKQEISQRALTTSSAPTTAYITTSVHMYYLPIITKQSEFKLNNGDGIRLKKSTMINPEKTFTFLGREYYYASVTVNGTTHKGYVPTAFTVEVLDENFSWNEFSLVKIKSGKVFADQNLTELLFELKDGQSIKVIDIKDGIAQIAVENSESVSIGFIDSRLIKNPSSDWIKIVIVIIAVGICILGTGLYLINRKKK